MAVTTSLAPVLFSISEFKSFLMVALTALVDAGVVLK